jgi:hypothetical protein
MEDIEYRDYDPTTGHLRTADGVSVREYVRRVRGMTVEQFEQRYGSVDCETRVIDPRILKFRLMEKD